MSEKDTILFNEWLGEYNNDKIIRQHVEDKNLKDIMVWLKVAYLRGVRNGLEESKVFWKKSFYGK